MNTIPTTFDDPVQNHNDYEQKLLGEVKEFGWRSTHVRGGENRHSFAYSTGFWKTFGKPEVIFFDLPVELAHDVLGQIYRLFEQGESLHTEKPVSGIISDEEVFFLTVSEVFVSEYLLSSKWFYKGSVFPCIQMIWSDGSGKFPWEPDFDPQLAELQPEISEIGWSRLRPPQTVSNWLFARIRSLKKKFR